MSDRYRDEIDPGIECTPGADRDDNCFGCLSQSLHEDLYTHADYLFEKLEAFERLIEELNARKPISSPRAVELGKITGNIAAACELLRHAAEYWDDCLDDQTRRFEEAERAKENLN